jgi:hypothetical protein
MIKDVGVINNLRLCESLVKYDHANPLVGIVKVAKWTCTSRTSVFDVKMDFTRKARWVKDGHKSPDSTIASFAGVVSRESIRIGLTYAALLGLPVVGGDIQDAYLQAPSSEKHFIVCGPDFGTENVGRVALICRALY